MSHSIALPATCMWDPIYTPDIQSCAAIQAVTGWLQTWTLPAEDEATCLAPKACLEIFQDQERYSLKPQTDCVTPYNAGKVEFQRNF